MPTKTATPAKAKADKSIAPKKRSGIQITGDGKYPLVPLNKIEIVERPKEGEQKLFFNPRELASFTPESMAELRLSIRCDGLQTPPLVRGFTKNDSITRIELIAGERRLRSVQYIVEHDLPCFDEDVPRPAKYKAGQIVISKGHFAKVVAHDDGGVKVQLLDGDAKLTDEQRTFSSEDVYPTVPGSALYENIPCKVAYDINDARALRLAFTENDKARSLSTKEEIALVERLGRMDLKVAEIAEMLGSNETWVSQTANFREALPPEALARLLEGTMKRHVAVNIMGYKPADRAKLFKATVEAEAEETAAKIEAADDEAIKAEDEEVLALDEAKKAGKAGDTKGANKAKRKAASAAVKASKAHAKKDRAEAEAGQIRTGHVQKGASTAGLNPKKAKMLPKEEIEEKFIAGMEEFLTGDGTDPICGEEVPGDLAAIVRLTAIAIISGNRDALSPIRQYMVEQERWEVKEGSEEVEDDGESAYADDDEESAFAGDDDPSDDDLNDIGDDDDDEDFAPRGRGRGRSRDYDSDTYEKEWN